MSPEDRIRPRHMLEAMEAALAFVEGRHRADLDRDRQLVFALVRAVEIVGEAASKLTAECRAALPAVPWTSIVGMRNRLVHAYFDVDLDILWNTAVSALPRLCDQIRPAVASAPDDVGTDLRGPAESS